MSARVAKRRVNSSNGASGWVTVERWAALVGLWQFKGPTAVYQGPEAKDVPLRYGVATGAPAFRDGTLQTRVTLSKNEGTTAGLMVGLTSIEKPYVMAQIGAYEKAYALSEFRPDSGWKGLATAGRIENVEVGVEHELTLRLHGQELSMSVDSVNVLSHTLRKPLEGEGMGLFAWGDHEIRFEETRIEAARPKIFVIMPFSQPFDTLYEEIIWPVAHDQLGYEILRVDEIQAPGIILEDIQRQIAGSHAVVAEISTRNPNVFYELGYAHALRKPAILLVRREDSGEIPFDIKGYRAIFYDDSIAGKNVVERNLREYLKAVQRGPGESEVIGF